MTLPGRVLFFDLIKEIAEEHTDQVKDQIVYIQPPPEGEKLGTFDQQKQAEGKQEKTPEGAQTIENFRQKKSAGNEQRDVANQIDGAVANQITIAAVLQGPHIVTDGIEGLYTVIPLDLHPIILVIWLACTEEQKVDHPTAV